MSTGAVCCSVLQCVAVCCSVLQCGFGFPSDCGFRSVSVTRLHIYDYIHIFLCTFWRVNTWTLYTPRYVSTLTLHTPRMILDSWNCAISCATHTSWCVDTWTLCTSRCVGTLTLYAPTSNFRHIWVHTCILVQLTHPDVWTHELCTRLDVRVYQLYAHPEDFLDTGNWAGGMCKVASESLQKRSVFHLECALVYFIWNAGGTLSPHRCTLQLTATHCTAHTATHCNTLQHTATHCNAYFIWKRISAQLDDTATHCNTLQHTGTHWHTLPDKSRVRAALFALTTFVGDSETHCNTLQRTATQYTATHCNTHCNTLCRTVCVDDIHGRTCNKCRYISRHHIDAPLPCFEAFPTCIYTYTHKHTDIYIYTHIYIYIYKYIH